MGAAFRKMFQQLFSKKLEAVVVGLDNSGKTTLLSVLADGEPTETAPTVGLNVKTMQKGKVTMKCWDIGGQAKFRSEWPRYTKGCDAILFVVDAANFERMSEARKELHRLLEHPGLSTTPVLVLANKIDLQPHVSEIELIKELNLDYIVDNPWLVVPCSALRVINIDQVLDWLIAQSK
mmetsp:Transcript_47897/g.70884  ORF Transcript_47897/g.70884 Transcript_47897/m.70884 type:complete len:178 (-) Transcript_47897:15-548(-)